MNERTQQPAPGTELLFLLKKNLREHTPHTASFCLSIEITAAGNVSQPPLAAGGFPL